MIKLKDIINENKATSKVWIAPIVNGRLYFLIIIPVKIICVLQNKAPNTTRVSPNLTVASWKFVSKYPPIKHKITEGHTLQCKKSFLKMKIIMGTIGT